MRNFLMAVVFLFCSDLTAKTSMGYMTGSFDPMHNGHLRVAIESLEQLGLDEVSLIPHAVSNSDPDFRMSLAQRVDMMTIAIEGIDYLKVGKAVNILQVLAEDHPDEVMHLILGASEFAEYTRANTYADLLDHVNLVLFTWQDHVVDYDDKTLRFLEQNQVALTDYDAGRTGQVLIINSPCFIEISQSTFHEKMSKNEDLRGILSDRQLAYIKEHGLYAADGA